MSDNQEHNQKTALKGLGHTEDPYDIIIVGLGAMGSSSYYQAAKKGLKVLGIE